MSNIYLILIMLPFGFGEISALLLVAPRLLLLLFCIDSFVSLFRVKYILFILCPPFDSFLSLAA